MRIVLESPTLAQYTRLPYVIILVQVLPLNLTSETILYTSLLLSAKAFVRQSTTSELSGYWVMLCLTRASFKCFSI